MKRVLSKDGISPWKIDNFLERWLSKKADKSFFWKRAYCLFYRAFDSKYYKKGLDFIDSNIKRFVGDVNSAQRKLYIYDMVYSLHRFGCMFDEYFEFDFEHLNTKGRESFITDKQRWNYYDRMNDRENLDLFNDKCKAYNIFKQFYCRELLEITNADFQKFSDFYDRHDKFIVKPQNGSGGKGIFILSKKDFPTVEEAFSYACKNGSVVIEELIIQSESMAILNPATVNTVRVPTIKIKDRVVIFHPFVRCGRGNSIVDNASSGGILAEVDAETGIVITKGVNELGESFVMHPTSKVVIPGFRIPCWDQAVKLVEELAHVVQTNNYVGWDLALTDDGWVMVEGNPRGQLLSQIASKKGIKKELEYYIDKM